LADSTPEDLLRRIAQCKRTLKCNVPAMLLPSAVVASAGQALIQQRKSLGCADILPLAGMVAARYFAGRHCLSQQGGERCGDAGLQATEEGRPVNAYASEGQCV